MLITEEQRKRVHEILDLIIDEKAEEAVDIKDKVALTECGYQRNNPGELKTKEISMHIIFLYDERWEKQ